MELGALICKPSNPSCSDCPLNAHCHYFAARKVSLTALGVSSLALQSKVAAKGQQSDKHTDLPYSQGLRAMLVRYSVQVLCDVIHLFTCRQPMHLQKQQECLEQAKAKARLRKAAQRRR